MTTYLLTHRGLTLPFCSALCRASYAQKTPTMHPNFIHKSPKWRNDDHYEFDEKCTNCGHVVLGCLPAHEVSVYKIGWCYQSACSCGLISRWPIGSRQYATAEACDHAEQRGSMADEDALWTFGTVDDFDLLTGSFAEVPKLRLTVRGREDITVKTKNGDVATTLMKMAAGS